MNILRLNKVIGVIEVVITLKELQPEDEVVFILSENSSIFTFIEKLSINGVDLNRLKIVNEISFNFRVLLKDKNNGEIIAEARSLSKVLEHINTAEINRYMLVLITDEKDRDVVSDIMQQFVYLDLHIDVMLEKEEYERNAVKAFRENLNKIKVALKVARQGVYEAPADKKLQGGKNKFVNAIDDIECILQEAEKRQHTVAVMATKKAGKSVIVNSFLGNEYAPTSFELATPNSIIYKSSNENKIELKYRNDIKEFESVDLIRNHVESIYKNAELEIKAEEPLEDMHIEYKKEKQSLNNFTIIDTPGPNLAGSNHKEIAYKWIETADVIVFTIDYTKYLTTDEENYLRDIKTFFDKYDKSHSLIVIVNKIDLLYTSGEKNSVVRFLDFLQFKLKELGYKGFVIFAASALQYFSAVKVPKLQGCEHLHEVKSEELMRKLRKCKSSYMGQKEMSLIRTLEDYIRDIEDYHGIKDACLYEVMEKSGMTRVIDYTNYITTQRANFELFKAVMRRIDDRFVNIKNNFLAFQISNLSDSRIMKQKEKQDLNMNIRKLSQLVDVADIKIQRELDFNELEKQIEAQCNVSEYELLELISKPIEKEIASIKQSLRHSTNDELRDIFEGSTDIISSKVKTNFSRILSDMFNEKIGRCQNIINIELDRKEERLSNIDKKIQEHIVLFNDYLNTSLQAENINIILPKLELAFTRKNFDFTRVDAKASTEIYDILKKSLHKKHGVIGHLMKIATLNHVDIRLGKYEIDFDSIDEMLDSLVDDMKNEVVYAIKENNRKILRFVRAHLTEELQPKIKHETDAMLHNYKELIVQIKDAFQGSETGIEKDIKFIQEKINFLEVARGSLQMFFDVWETVREQAGDSQRYADKYVCL
jgi:small GTP-binding protein